MVGPIRSEQTYYGSLSLAQQAHRQMSTYWRVRFGKTLEQFELEARRMLTLEAALEEFAQYVHRAMAPMVRSAFDNGEPMESITTRAQLPLPVFVWVASQIGASRRNELKARYRRLAKEVHPDMREGDSAKVSLGDISDAYQQEDLARVMRLEAELLFPDLSAPANEIEDFLRQVEQATATYKKSYTEMLHSPLYQLYSRANCAKGEGWDWLEITLSRAGKLLQQTESLAA